VDYRAILAQRPLQHVKPPFVQNHNPWLVGLTPVASKRTGMRAGRGRPDRGDSVWRWTGDGRSSISILAKWVGRASYTRPTTGENG